MKNRTTKKNSAARHGVGKQAPLNCYCPWMEYEVWTRSGYQVHLWVCSRNLLPPLTSLWGTLCERRSIPHPLMTQCRGLIMMQQYVLWFILILHDHCSMRLLLLMNNRRKDWLISCGCLLLLFFLYLDGETKSISSLLMLKLISSSLRQPGCTIVNRLFRGWDRGAINGLYCHISEDFTSGTSSHPECNMCLYTCAF